MSKTVTMTIGLKVNEDQDRNEVLSMFHALLEDHKFRKVLEYNDIKIPVWFFLNK
jgi:Golgi nucleoside diphosphatase